ncbi:MAG: AAA family ATPase, partial [Gammaproteobacteria bacterium]|nr:AAA family ATPase [Gammaproteobacteria bacterium]
MSLDSEKQILGSVLINPKIMSSVDLNEDHFSTVPHQHIFAAMRMMSGQQFDVVQLADFMSEHHVGTNWLAILGEMQKDVFSAANYKAHEVIVRKDAAKRFAMLAAQEILDADGSAEVVDSVVSRLLRQEQPQARSIVTLNEAVSEAFTAMEMAQGSQGVTGVPTGLAALDEKIDGYHAGELYIVAGRPGMGKTAFLLRNALSSGVPTLIFSCEQPSLQLGMRSLSLTARVNHHRMRIGKMEEHDWAALVAASGDLHDQRVFIDDRADQTIEGIRQSARYMYHKHDIKIILIDYIQLLTTRQKTQTRDQEITIISR